MCDVNGEYHFANGNIYKGSFRQCSKLVSNKFGQFEGEGILNLFGLGKYVGQFQNNGICGNGKFTSFDGSLSIDKTWQFMTIQEFTYKISALNI